MRAAPILQAAIAVTLHYTKFAAYARKKGWKIVHISSWERRSKTSDDYWSFSASLFTGSCCSHANTSTLLSRTEGFFGLRSRDDFAACIDAPQYGVGGSQSHIEFAVTSRFQGVVRIAQCDGHQTLNHLFNSLVIQISEMFHRAAGVLG
jgi:hypothetical protein